MTDDEAFQRLVQDEADAMAGLIETPHRKVMVVVLAVEGDELHIARAASVETPLPIAEALLGGLEHVCERVRYKIAEKRIGR